MPNILIGHQWNSTRILLYSLINMFYVFIDNYVRYIKHYIRYTIGLIHNRPNTNSLTFCLLNEVLCRYLALKVSKLIYVCNHLSLVTTWCQIRVLGVGGFLSTIRPNNVSFVRRSALSLKSFVHPTVAIGIFYFFLWVFLARYFVGPTNDVFVCYGGEVF